ncbi:MAG: hypothetical protein M9911_14455 [Saprospiraceae bacterium]|nr:hypothetical protein [Saprospiraceae bacterium]
MNKLTNRHRQENANAQMAHLVLPDTQADPSQNQKSHFLPTHQLTTTDV